MITKGVLNDLDRYHEMVSIPELKLANGEYLSKNDLKEYINDDYFLIYKENNFIKGLIFGERLKGNGLMIWMLVVDDKFRDMGIGRKLIEKLEEKAKKNHIEWVILYGYNTKNVIEFYNKLNYKKGVETVEFLKEIK